jgi:DNA-binding CsgD family transcriptional regulator
MPECYQCGATEVLGEGVVVGKRDPEADPKCNECLAEYLERDTMLSEREAEVVAFTQLSDMRLDILANALDISENTAQEYYRRARDKADLARVTTTELEELL